MKIIFLDIDGVLNNQEWIKKQMNFLNFCPDNITALNYIVEKTGAKIVISSNWRLYPYNFSDLFKSQGIIGEVIGKTPIYNIEINGIFRTITRGQEIKAWLKDIRGIESFVILDDDADMGDLIFSLVRTNSEYGLTVSDARDAINLLRE